MPVKEYDENGGDVPAPVPAPPSKHPFLQLLVEQDVVDLHLILEGALCDRTVGPTGSAAPEPGFFLKHVELLLLYILEINLPLCLLSKT